MGHVYCYTINQYHNQNTSHNPTLAHCVDVPCLQYRSAFPLCIKNCQGGLVIDLRLAKQTVTASKLSGSDCDGLVLYVCLCRLG